MSNRKFRKPTKQDHLRMEILVNRWISRESQIMQDEEPEIRELVAGIFGSVAETTTIYRFLMYTAFQAQLHNAPELFEAHERAAYALIQGHLAHTLPEFANIRAE